MGSGSINLKVAQNNRAHHGFACLNCSSVPLWGPMKAFRDFFKDDLVRVAATISDSNRQRRFRNTIVDNTNYQRDVGGRTVARLYQDDLDEVLRLAEGTALSFEDVPE